MADQPVAAKYLFLDAKYSTTHTVKKYEVRDLARKYLFSVGPKNPQDEVLGLLIINGQLSRGRNGRPFEQGGGEVGRIGPAG